MLQAAKYLISNFTFTFTFLIVERILINNALCNKSNGRCDIKAEKREELESKSSHKSDIWPPAASKNEVKYTENIFFRL